jgi:hypothetical protein
MRLFKGQTISVHAHAPSVSNQGCSGWDVLEGLDCHGPKELRNEIVKDEGWWAMTGSNCRPSRCKRDALPTELIALQTIPIRPMVRSIHDPGAGAKREIKGAKARRPAPLIKADGRPLPAAIHNTSKERWQVISLPHLSIVYRR